MDEEDARLLIEAGAAHGVAVGAEALERIGSFLDLLAVWNRRIRLTGDQDPGRLLRKHVVDCLAPAALLPPKGLVVDIGAGGGFPGLVLGCLRPDLELLLVEPRRRPHSFLAEVLRSISLPKGRAIEARGEDLAAAPTVKASARLVISRALRIDLFLPLAAPLLAPDGIAVAMQTPSLEPSVASAVGTSTDLTLREVRDYQLPDGERRRLIVFARR